MTAKTVEKSLQLLELLAASTEPRGAAELAREMGMPKTNVFRLLTALAAQGYARRRAEDSRFEPTLKLWELGNLVLARLDLREVARPFLDRLVEETGESALLAVLDRGESVYVDKRDGRHPIRGFTRIGSRAPAYCSATGKAELAHQSPEAVDRVCAELRRFTPATITEADDLLSELAGVRANGFAVNRGEWFEDVWGVAAPVRDASGMVRASLGIWGPQQRVAKMVPLSARAVTAAADELSAALGFGRAAPNHRRASP